MPLRLHYLIGTFFGTGFAPFAPATVASFAFMIVWWLAWMLIAPIPWWVTAGLLVAVTWVGVGVSDRLEQIHGEDPSLVVIDEVAGMLVTYLGVTTVPAGLVIGFFWFRFFDIAKPLGVRRLEKAFGGGGAGIMMDDIGAGVLACLATHGTLWGFARLGW